MNALLSASVSISLTATSWSRQIARLTTPNAPRPTTCNQDNYTDPPVSFVVHRNIPNNPLPAPTAMTMSEKLGGQAKLNTLK